MNNLTRIIELDLRGCNNLQSSLSIVNTKGTTLQTLIIDNSNIDITQIQTAINNISNNFNEGVLKESWISESWHQCRGFIALNENFDFSKCTEIRNYVCGVQDFSTGNYEIDLSTNTNLTTINIGYDKRNYIFPASVQEASIRCKNNTINLSKCINLTYLELVYYTSEMESLRTLPSNNKLNTLSLYVYQGKDLSFLEEFNASSLINLSVYGWGSLSDTKQRCIFNSGKFKWNI